MLPAQSELPAEARALPWQRAERPDETDRGAGLMLSTHLYWEPAFAATRHMQRDRPIMHLQTRLVNKEEGSLYAMLIYHQNHSNFDTIIDLDNAFILISKLMKFCVKSSQQ